MALLFPANFTILSVSSAAVKRYDRIFVLICDSPAITSADN